MAKQSIPVQVCVAATSTSSTFAVQLRCELVRPLAPALHEAAIMRFHPMKKGSGILPKEMEITKNLWAVYVYRRFLYVDSGFG